MAGATVVEERKAKQRCARRRAVSAWAERPGAGSAVARHSRSVGADVR